MLRTYIYSTIAFRKKKKLGNKVIIDLLNKGNISVIGQSDTVFEVIGYCSEEMYTREQAHITGTWWEETQSVRFYSEGG